MLQAQSELSLYGGILDYADSSKDQGWFAGAYFQQSTLSDRLEFAYERTELSYVDAASADLKQNDFTAVWTHYLNGNYLFRVGGHYIDSSDGLSDGGYSLFAGVKYFEGYAFDVGVDAYYSHYAEYLADDLTTKGLDVLQFEPSLGAAFGDYSSIMGSFYAKLYYVYIKPDDEGYALLHANYHSGGISLTNYHGKWTTLLNGWMGKQVFAMRNGGFVMYNLTEEHRGGAELSVHYAFTEQLGIKVQYGYERFKESDHPDASSTVMSGYLDYRF